jgi:hypothetical protein
MYAGTAPDAHVVEVDTEDPLVVLTPRTMIPLQEHPARSWTGVAKSVLSVAALLLVVVGVAAATTMVTLRASLPRGDAQIAHNAVSFADMVVKPSFEDCAKKTESCLLPKCCAVSGLTCYKTNATYGRCMKTCTKGGANGTCEEVPLPTKPVVEEPGLSLFCFSVYTKNTGSFKVSHELELLQKQKQLGVSIFSCADWAVYGDVVAPLDGGYNTIQVRDVKNDFHILKRKRTGTWVNTGTFVQVWLAIKADGRWERHNWVVKCDADAVFFPSKLLNVLNHATVPKEGVYMENCKYVDEGYFGNLEVFSKQAFATLTANLEHCYESVPWKVGIQNGKYGPMGEDLFAQKCMDKMGVAKQENFYLTTDGACEADRPAGEKKNKKFIPKCAGVTTPTIHPFKKPEMYFKCMNEASSAYA